MGSSLVLRGKPGNHSGGRHSGYDRTEIDGSGEIYFGEDLYYLPLYP